MAHTSSICTAETLETAEHLGHVNVDPGVMRITRQMVGDELHLGHFIAVSLLLKL